MMNESLWGVVKYTFSVITLSADSIRVHDQQNALFFLMLNNLSLAFAEVVDVLWTA